MMIDDERVVVSERGTRACPRLFNFFVNPKGERKIRNERISPSGIITTHKEKEEAGRAAWARFDNKKEGNTTR